MGLEIPPDWLEHGIDRAKQTPHSVKNDRWDRESHDHMRTDVEAYAAAGDALAEFTPTGEPAAPDTFWSVLKADPQLEDEQDMLPSHLLNRSVLDEVQSLPETGRLRRYSVNDEVQAALAFATIEPDVETLFDKHQQEQQKLDDLEETLSQLGAAQSDLSDMEADLDEMMQRMQAIADGVDPDDICDTCGGSGQVPGDDGAQGDDAGDGAGQDGAGDDAGAGQGQPGGSGSPAHGQGSQPCPDCSGQGTKPGAGAHPGSGGQDNKKDGSGRPELTDQMREALNAQAEAIQKAQEKVKELQEQAREQAGEVEAEVNACQPSIQVAVRDMMSRAADEAQAINDAALAWGLDPGELQRMSAEERMALAKKLNSDRFRKIAELWGPMKNLMLSEQARKTVHVREEIVDVETGNDITRLLPSELASIRHPILRLNFLRKFANRGLMQYGMEGTERLARGGIIFCEDGSGSMRGERELWSKAVMLCLLDLAKRQKRTMHVIHFGGPGATHHIPFVKPSDFTFERIVEAAEIFYGGGTDFETPMREALAILQDEHARTGGVKADVVFMTDDECWVRDEFMEEYVSEMHRMDSATWGISATGVRPSKGGALDTMCEGRTCAVSDFLSGNDVRTIFRGV